jgi:DNA polymerase III subunit epsilon
VGVREVVFDTETTGLSASGGDRLVEIGCVELVGRRETGRHFHVYINPERGMPAEAEAVHGLSEAFLADKPLFAEVAEELLAFLGDDTPLIAHNANFDFGFINAELARLSLVPLATERMVDTVAMARRLHPGGKHSLDALCTRYGIDRSHRIKHGALLDAELLAQLYIEMTGGRQIGLDLAAETGEEMGLVDSPAIPRPSADQWRAPRPHEPTAAERERHVAFVASIKDALWTAAT